MAPEWCGSNLKMYFSNLFYELISWALPVKLVLGKCHLAPLMISQHRFRCHQAASHYPDLCFYMASSILLTHWGCQCVSKLTVIVSNNGLSPVQRQAIIWNNDGILLIGPLGRSFSKIFIQIYPLSFKDMLLKMLSGKWQPCWLSLNVLTIHFVHPERPLAGHCVSTFPGAD